jgi:hypothetical protein
VFGAVVRHTIVSLSFVTAEFDLSVMESSTGPKERKFNSELIVAVSAIIISVITAAVTGYQALIMREQQYSSVLPYLQWQMTLDPREGFSLTVTNKGVGPAIVKSTLLAIDGAEVDVLTYLKRVVGSVDSSSVYYSSIDRLAISPGEQVLLFRINQKGLMERVSREVYNRTKFDICFCDIYNSCWTSSGSEVRDDSCAEDLK